MDSMLLPILVAAAVVLLTVSLVRLARFLLDPDRRKLQQRLSTESHRSPRGQTAAGSSIRVDNEAKGISATLVKIGLLNRIHRRILHSYPDLSLAAFLSIVGMLAIAAGSIVTLCFDSPLIGCGAAVAGGYLPFMFLNSKRKKRQTTMSLQLPEALDFLSRILKAGHSLSTGMQMMADELPKPLSEEFRRAYDQQSLGLSMDETLKEMATRIESTDFAFFVTAVLIQRQTGGDLSEVLNNISGMIRQRIRLQQHVKAKTAEGRFTGYILSGFPAVMFALVAVLNPKQASILWTTPGGLGMLGGAFALTIMGLFFIKKLTTVRV